MRERDIERFLVRRVKELGGEVRKLQFIGRRGAPDRMVMFPEGKIFFCELKRPGGVVEAHQAREHARMLKMGQRVLVLDTIDKVERWLA